MVTYPQKKLNYGQVFGRVSCEPWSQTGAWGYGIKFLPTDGSGRLTITNCDGTTVSYPTGTSNQLKYLKDNNWGISLGITQYTMYQYPEELKTLGAGHTQMDEFKRFYMDYCEAHGIKYWLEIAEIMNDQSRAWTYRTPPTDMSWYTPPTGLATSYEARIGSAIDFMEQNAGPNFQGYTFEQCFENGLKWLRSKTKYAISQKNWDGFYNNLTDDRQHNVLMSTNPDGSDVVPMVTPLQHIGELDELIIEIYMPEEAYFVDRWINLLPRLLALYPNLPIVLNIDQLCIDTGWTGGTPPVGSPTETGTDHAYWAPAGVGQPSNRCATEKQYAINRINKLRNALGKPFDGMCYNFLWSAFPQSGASRPDVTWFLQWADQNVGPLLITGGDITTTYTGSISNAVSVPVTEAAVATQLTAVAPASATMGIAFTITGVLKTTAGVVIPNQLIQLQKAGVNVVGKTATTNASGGYSISVTETTVGTHTYNTVYAGGTV
jgi:hypothetical protein